MAQPGRIQPLPRNARRIPMPPAVLGEWLAEIDDLGELKVALRAVALLASEPMRRDVPPSLSLVDLLDDEVLRRATQPGDDLGIRQALAACLSRGTLVAVRVGGEIRVWLNDESCRRYLEKAQSSLLGPADVSGVDFTEKPLIDDAVAIPSGPARANIFALYEQHVGTFGHGMAEQLRAAEEEYPASWIEEAFEIAAERGARSWIYVRAILMRWLQEGKPGGVKAAPHQQRERRYDDGKPGHDSAPDSRTGYLESYRRRHGRLPWESDDTHDGTRG